MRFQTVPWLLAAALVAPMAATGDEARLDAVSLGSRPLAAADWTGEIVTLERESGRLRIWSAEGKQVATLNVRRLGLQGRVGRLALRPNSVLLLVEVGPSATQDHTESSISSVEAVAIDLSRGGLSGRHRFGGSVVFTRVGGTREGWVAVMQAPVSHSCVINLLDPEGKLEEQMDLDTRWLEDLDERLHRAETGDLIPVSTRRDLWLVPRLDYQLWHPAQHGRSANRVIPPSCLTATAKILSGDAAAQRLLEKADGPQARERVREILQSFADAGDPMLLTGDPPVVAAAAYRDLVGVLVRTEESLRVDVWDTSRDLLLCHRMLKDVAEPRALALADGHAWILDGDRFVRIELPCMEGPGALDPCSQQAGRGDGRQAAN